MRRLWKTLATLAVLVLLHLPASPISERSMPKIPWVILFILALTYGISLFFSTKVPAYRRWGIAYLALTGFTYLLAGIQGLLPNGELIEAAMWHSLVSPYPLLTLVRHGIPHSPHDTEWGEIYVFPTNDHSIFFSIAVVVIASVAIVTAFLMPRDNKRAYTAWLILVGLSILAALGYVVAGIASWGPHEAILPSCWAVTYLIAYIMARVGVLFKTKSVPDSGDSSKQ